MLLAALLALAVAPDASPKTWTFDVDPPGALAPGFTVEAGRWEVLDIENTHVLAQRAANDDKVFNMILADQPRFRDVDLAVRLKPMAGEHDQGGGLAWRVSDARNYYLARYNPLEDNLRVYKVVEGKRTQLQSAEGLPRAAGWHNLRVTMTGGQIRCWLDGLPPIDVTDTTFPDAGRIGLWTKADAQTLFDDLSVRPVSARP